MANRASLNIRNIHGLVNINYLESEIMLASFVIS